MAAKVVDLLPSRAVIFKPRSVQACCHRPEKAAMSADGDTPGKLGDFVADRDTKRGITDADRYIDSSIRARQRRKKTWHGDRYA